MGTGEHRDLESQRRAFVNSNQELYNYIYALAASNALESAGDQLAGMVVHSGHVAANIVYRMSRTFRGQSRAAKDEYRRKHKLS